MEGMPAKFRIDARIILVSVEGRAYSLRYMAQATPNGTANNVVIKVSTIVPNIAGKIPPWVMPCVGNEAIKLKDILEKPFEKISHNMIPKNKQTINVLPVSISQLAVLMMFFLFIGHGIFLIDLQNIRLIN